MNNLLQLKQAAFNHCMTYIESRIHLLETVLNNLEESRNNESKSSVGDKYETGRAMIQLEEEKNKTQLLNALHAKAILMSVKPDNKCNKVETGSLVITNRGTYFIAIATGKMNIDGNMIYGISIDAPIGQAMKHKHEGDKVLFNKQHIFIQAII